MKPFDPERVGRGQLAAILGVSAENIRILTNSGTLKSLGAGKYVLAEAVQAYIAWVHHGRASAAHAQERSSEAAERRRRLQLENDQTEGLLIAIAEVETVVDRVATTFRSVLEGIPGRLSKDLATMSDAGLIRERLQDEHRRALNAAADGFAGLTAAEADGGSATATAAPNGVRVGERMQGAAAR